MEFAHSILNIVARNEAISSADIAELLNVDHQKIIGGLKSIQCLGNIIECEQVATTVVELTQEGQQVAEHGSHEFVVFSAVPDEGILQSELMKKVPNANIGFSKAIAMNWIRMDKKAGGGPRVFRSMPSVEDSVRECLVKIRDLRLDSVTDAQKSDYKKRKLIADVKKTVMIVRKGEDFRLEVAKDETDLTAEMITMDSWKTKTFKAYNFDALGVPPSSGHLHPLLRVRAEFRRIFMDMGFSEMPTNNYVESSFWNFDSLFQPQQHPARDAHDTFFLKDPAATTDLPPAYVAQVKRVHSEGGFGSQGYKYDWSLEEAQKNILRTHTTAVSARMLYRLAQQDKFTPVRYFSIDRVFRNESLDATHLAEFHQIEGLVADYGLTLGDLMGTIHNFYRKLGLEKLRFKPAYNPYTEPSMEIFGYHEGLKKWVEIGNSGIFRPEMLLPLGIPEGVNVIAWGLSLERPTMIKYGYNNIRDLIGPKVDLRMVYEAPLCRLDK